VRELEAIRRVILEALAWGLAITFALALGGGLTMSWSVVRRLEAINQTSRDIMEGDLSRRIPADGSGDDFDQLAGNLNLMLERISGLMESVRQVSDSIAHDLRTPLTRLRSQLELASTQLEQPEEARAALEQAIEDANELLATFNALMRIARIESGGRRAGFSEVDISTLVCDVAEFYEPLAADKGQQLTLEVDDGMTVNGDRDLLFQAIANLLDNAIKYTPRSGRVTLGARKLADDLEVTVADTGPGIPAELRTKVFQRFFRLDSSRSTPGSGLGLSLVQAAADLHGVQIALDDNCPGLRVRLCFPQPRSLDAAERDIAPEPADSGWGQN
jgi:signal transduction histidine kinase